MILLQKNHPSRQITSDLQGSLAEEDVAKLEVIKNIVRSAEIEINNIAASLTQNREQKTMHLPEPNYFDEDFDQKSYIQDLVSAKIHGMKVVEQDTAASKIQKIMILKQALETISDRRSDGHETKRSKSSCTSGGVSNKTAGKDANFESQNSPTKQNEMGLFYPKNEDRVVSEDSLKSSRNEMASSEKVSKAGGRYTRLSIRNHKLVEIKSDVVEEITEAPVITNSRLSITTMPSVNIRSELIEQKIPSLDIYPEDQNNIQPGKTSNVGLIRSEHSDQKTTGKRVQINLPEEQFCGNEEEDDIPQTDFKILTGQQILEDKNMESILNKFASQGRHKTSENLQTRHQNVGSMLNDSNQPFLFFDRSKSDNQCSSFPSTSYSKKVSKLKKYAIPEIQKIYNPKSNVRKTVSKKSSIISSSYFTQLSKHSSVNKTPQTFDSKLYDVPILKGSKGNSYHSSTEYIPYSKLTVGGLNPDEINKYIHETDKKANAKTQYNMNSGEALKGNQSVSGNDFNDTKSEANEDGNKSNHSDRSDHSESSKERSKSNKTSSEAESSSSEEKSPNDYVDDFDDDSKSHDSQQKSKSDTKSPNSKKDTHLPQGNRKTPITLKLKKSIEVFDFFHAIETKDDSTQSGVGLFSNFKQTQTSPRETETKESVNEFKLNVSENSSQKVDIANLTLRDMMQIQKSLALLNINFFTNQLNENNPDDTPACSKNNEPKLNKESNVFFNVHSSEDLTVKELSLPKNTQTSPLISCHAMTSPTEMVNRILSPIFRDVKIDAGTSPCDINVSLNSEELTHNNVTLPKPQSTNIQSSAQEALSNLETALKNKNDQSLGNKDLKEKFMIIHHESSPNPTLKDSTDAYTDVSHSESSETHSLGEINLRILRKKSFIIRRQAKSDSNSNIHSPVTSSSSDVQVDRTNYGRKSDGEVSIGQIIIEK